MKKSYFITVLITAVLVLVIVLLFVYVGIVHGLDLKALQEELHKRGDPWIAGKTSVSDLPLSVKRQMCNLRLPKGYTARRLKEHKPTKHPPSEWDWRNKDGQCWMTPVRDQGDCGSCWDFAWVGAHEARWNIWNNLPHNDVDLSEQFVLSCNPYGYNCISGGRLDLGDWIMNTTNGIPDEGCFPYAASDLPCDNRCSDWETRAAPYDLEDWGQIPASNTEAVKNELMRGPIAVAITVKEDFFYYLGGVYEPIMGDDLGGGIGMPNHGVCCVGWNASGQWIFKNSWGPGWGSSDLGCWGENGYGTIGLIEAQISWMDPLEAGGRGWLTVYNKSFACEDLKVTDIEKDVNWIKSIEPKSFTLSPGDSQTVSVCTDPNVSPGSYETTIRILSNDPTRPSYSVTVTLKVTSGGKGGGESREKVISGVLTLNCYPNPVTKKATIIYTLSEPAPISLNLYDVSGRKIKSIVEEEANSGTHVMKVETKDLTPGIYFVSLQGINRRISQKIILTH